MTDPETPATAADPQAVIVAQRQVVATAREAMCDAYAHLIRSRLAADAAELAADGDTLPAQATNAVGVAIVWDQRTGVDAWFIDETADATATAGKWGSDELLHLLSQAVADCGENDGRLILTL